MNVNVVCFEQLVKLPGPSDKSATVMVEFGGISVIVRLPDGTQRLGRMSKIPVNYWRTTPSEI